MDLWIKNNCIPQGLPDHDYDQEDQIWTSLETSEEARTATGWSLAPTQPSFNPTTEMVLWLNGAWQVTALPAPPVVVAPPRRVSKIAFSRLLTNNEKASLYAAEYLIRNLTLSDRVTQPALVALEICQKGFDMLSEFIELDHPDTILAVSQVFVANGILTPTRAAQVLANELVAE
jgi:hypothetical protein